ncbi:MAG TPA: hypothetical protein ENI66_00750 [Candidatus Yonathbacteria bacterium]|nr:hypothetical protein [Candidatus Yonathbacteria bacterium]
MAKFNLKNIIKKFSFTQGKDKLKKQMHPYRDWGMLLLLFSVFLIISAVVNMYLFILVNKEELFVKNQTSEKEVEMLKVEELRNMIKFFDTRVENFNNISKQKPDVVDPSL